MEKTHSNNWDKYVHQYNGVKKKLQSVSFAYIWTIFEHQGKDMYASQKVQIFLFFPGLKHISVLHRATNEQLH